MVMVDGDGDIYMAFGLCPKHKLCNDRLEKQLQYFLYKNYNVKRHLWSQERTLKSPTRKLYF